MEELKSIATMARELDEAITKAWSSYIDCHKELESFQGKELVGDNLKRVNEVLITMQSLYADLHHGLHFISFRNQFAINAMNSHQAFIDKIKEAGAEENNPEQTQPEEV